MSEIYCKECAELVSEGKDLEHLCIGIIGNHNCFTCGKEIDTTSKQSDSLVAEFEFSIFRDGTFKKLCDKYEIDCEDSEKCPFEDICCEYEYPDLNSPEAFRCDGKCKGCLYGIGCKTISPDVNPKDAWK